MERGVRQLKLKKCQLDQSGEVSYQALNAQTSAMLTVKGKQRIHGIPVGNYHDPGLSFSVSVQFEAYSQKSITFRSMCTLGLLS